jgi:hypothetical protein
MVRDVVWRAAALVMVRDVVWRAAALVMVRDVVWRAAALVGQAICDVVEEQQLRAAGGAASVM